MKKRPLSPQELDECAALKRVYLRQREHLNLTQEKVADALGMNQGSVSHYLNGRNALNADFAARIANVLQVPVDVFSPRLAKSITEMAVGAAPSNSAELVLQMLEKHGKNISAEAKQRIVEAVTERALPATQGDSNVIVADFSRRPLVGDEIRIAHYDVSGAMGGGKVVHDYPEMFKDVTVSQQYLRELGVTYKDPVHLKMITGEGESMAPTIRNLDPMISDVSIREFTGDGIYAFAWQGHFFIKRLQLADAEHFEMISDNPRHKDRVIRMDETYIQARILLVWAANRV